MIKGSKICGISDLNTLNFIINHPCPPQFIGFICNYKKSSRYVEIEQLVLKQAGLIKKSGCDGIVCSAQEAKLVRKKYKKLFIVTPGIRLPGDSANDQSRVMTPNDAFKNKVSGIVMGRSLIKGNIKNNIQKLIDHLNKWSRDLKSVGFLISTHLIL